jgi:hypothetical protein
VLLVCRCHERPVEKHLLALDAGYPVPRPVFGEMAPHPDRPYLISNLQLMPPVGVVQPALA